jgi:hypothetical protein
MTPFTMQRMRAEFDQDRGERETARLPTVSAAKVSEVRRMSAEDAGQERSAGHTVELLPCG